jgi:peptide-methionine (S)-S-oxide reductase
MKNNSKNNNLETAVFGAGCFWGVEARFSKVKGVAKTTVGYAGGTKEKPTYEDVLTKKTGHAEVVKVEFDPNAVSFEVLLTAFFEFHDPTTLDRQGPDVGSNYRSIILYTSEAQKQAAEKFIAKLEKEKIFTSPIVTEIKPLDAFWPAEEYHQQYFDKNSGKSACRI